jgi:6-phosphogluconolactonase
MSAPAPDVRVLDGLPALARAAAEEWRARAGAAVAASGRFAVALSGGSTPRALYALLASAEAPFRDALPWDRTHVFFADERAVPPHHPHSNYGMARDALLAHVPLPPGSVHRMRGEDDPALAARAYEEELRALLGPAPRLDLVLLGLGADGHTASLFPGSPLLAERSRLVAAAEAGLEPLVRRVTLTLPVLEGAGRVLFLVAGARKAAALARVLRGGEGADPPPAARVRPAAGALWLVDRAAARDAVPGPGVAGR